jgi:hypothetical protein
MPPAQTHRKAPAPFSKKPLLKDLSPCPSPPADAAGREGKSSVSFEYDPVIARRHPNVAISANDVLGLIMKHGSAAIPSPLFCIRRCHGWLICAIRVSGNYICQTCLPLSASRRLCAGRRRGARGEVSPRIRQALRQAQ